MEAADSDDDDEVTNLLNDTKQPDTMNAMEIISDKKSDENITFSSPEQHESSSFDIFFNICKCFAGAASFELPWAISQAGSIGGGVSLLILAWLTSYTLTWLAECGHYHPSILKPTYPEIARYAFGNIGFYIAWFGILAMTIGVCGSYLVFIGTEISIMTQHKYPYLTQSVCTLITTSLIVIMSWFRSYKLLVPTSKLGLLALLFALVVIVYHSNSVMPDSWNQVASNTEYFNFNGYPLFIGNAAFLYLIHSVVLPIEQSMSNRLRYAVNNGYKIALNRAIIIVTVLNLLFGEFVYLAFGDNRICGNCIDNLNNGWLKSLVRILLCLDLFFTYALFLFPMTESIEQTIFNVNNFGQWKTEVQRNILRTIIVFATCVIALLVPSFEKLTGLTGAFGNNVLGLILPPIIYFRLCRLRNVSVSRQHKLIGYFISLFGVFMLFVSTYFFIDSIIASSSSTSNVCI
eukprot:401965_1